MTVKSLIETLQTLPPDAEVQVWTPGAYLILGMPRMSNGNALIEAEVEIGDIDL
jgi:hypothetical protein